jgi:hypothetical protein
MMGMNYGCWQYENHVRLRYVFSFEEKVSGFRCQGRET